MRSEEEEPEDAALTNPLRARQPHRTISLGKPSCTRPVSWVAADMAFSLLHLIKSNQDMRLGKPRIDCNKAAI